MMFGKNFKAAAENNINFLIKTMSDCIYILSNLRSNLVYFCLNI